MSSNNGNQSVNNAQLSLPSTFGLSPWGDNSNNSSKEGRTAANSKSNLNNKNSPSDSGPVMGPGNSQGSNSLSNAQGPGNTSPGNSNGSGNRPMVSY